MHLLVLLLSVKKRLDGVASYQGAASAGANHDPKKNGLSR
jgi:hypothetical protein